MSFAPRVDKAMKCQIYFTDCPLMTSFYFIFEQFIFDTPPPSSRFGKSSVVTKALISSPLWQLRH